MWVVGLLLVVVVVGSLTLHGETRILVVDGLMLLSVWISAIVCWLAVQRVGFRHWEILLSAVAATLAGAGLTYLGVDGLAAGRCRHLQLRMWGSCCSTR